ncbi:TetR family transcriptional regulator [Streptomyces scopuliridis]|uniref:TetR family transcriptional regulator n=1 Tax=Streptomyces scopuliridis TaxID=452529 RepID=A0ACD4ZMF5_9ACTN|nr:TetR family transcriptional regulator [Streptomyces scopuliridis]WSB99635.1 TetR family transcriptional regulator [Streptomyces scopuliridis]WSC06666.1 TetR family transcriptional regulator [Streptomyces scopuliridis]
MPPDATATRSRLLEAATVEFARYGLAGARVDRIAEQAKANKRLIHVPFGTKEELFDLVVGRATVSLADTVPFTADALPEYTGALFDLLQRRPGILRLTTWALLERPEPIPVQVEAYRAKPTAIADAQARGVVNGGIEPVDLMATLLGPGHRLVRRVPRSAVPGARAGVTRAPRGHPYGHRHGGAGADHALSTHLPSARGPWSGRRHFGNTRPGTARQIPFSPAAHGLLSSRRYQCDERTTA